VVPRPEIATVERRGARSRSQRDHRVLSRGIAPRQRDRRLSGALRRSAAPLVRGVGRRTRDDPRAKRRAETRGDGTMEGNEGDVTMKRVRIGRMPNGQRGGAHRSTTVILRCERKRASKDERPPDSWPHTGRRPTDHGFTRRSDLERASRQQPTCDGPRFARAPQGDGHNRMRAA
jgi:hypothetical protein